MATITASMVKELRDKTGAGMMDCKNALAETGGDMEQAVDELRKRGQAIANKKGGRSAKEGLIFSKTEGNVGALLELNCETDFVARNEDFLALGNELLGVIFQPGAPTTPEALMDSPSAAAGKSYREVLTDAIAKIGENMGVARFQRVQAGEGAGFVQAYIHPPGKLGVLVELKAGKPETLASDAFKQLAADLAMQVAAATPLAIDRSSIPDDVAARERAIYVDQVRMEGKPEAILEKIVDGKMNKFFKDSCMLDQGFIKDPDQPVGKVIEAVAKQAGDTIELTSFVRFEVGELAKAKNAEEQPA